MLTKIETKCYLELAISQTRIVAKGQQHIQVFNLIHGEDKIQESLEEEEQ